MNQKLYFCLSFLVLISSGTAFNAQRTASEIAPLANWEKVETHITDIQVLVFYTGYYVFETAYLENETIALEIQEVLSVGNDESMKLLGILSEEFEARTMTVESAKLHLGELLVIISDTYTAMKPSLEQLTEETHIKINGYYSGLFLALPNMAEEVYKALEEPTPPSCAIRGFSPNVTVTLPSPLDNWTPPGTQFWTGTLDSVSEMFLLVHAHNKYLESEVSGTNPKTLSLTTSEEFPSFVGDTGVKIIHRTLMLQCFDSTTVTYKFEIEINTDPIVEPTVKPHF